MADKRKIENLKQPQLSRQATVELPSQMDPEGETKKAEANEARPEAAREKTDDYEIQGTKKKKKDHSADTTHHTTKGKHPSCAPLKDQE